MNPTETREALFSCLNSVLVVSQKKFKHNHARQELRLKWGRLIVQAVGTYGKLLETVQLDDMMEEIEAIKEHVGMKETENKQKSLAEVHH